MLFFHWLIAVQTDLTKFIVGEKAKEVWNELKTINVGKIEDRKIDVQVEMKGVSIGAKEPITEYITRGRGIMATSMIR